MQNPQQPSMLEWKFIEELKTPLHNAINWERSEKKENEADLDNGIFLEFNYLDKQGTLETAYADFKNFLPIMSTH